MHTGTTTAAPYPAPLEHTDGAAVEPLRFGVCSDHNHVAASPETSQPVGDSRFDRILTGVVPPSIGRL